MTWLCCSLAGSDAATADPLDWPNWRGPQQNRVSMEKGLVEKWDPDGGEGSNVLWKKKELGGRSTPIVMRGKLYTITHDKAETADEGEKVVCADAGHGQHPVGASLQCLSFRCAGRTDRLVERRRRSGNGPRLCPGHLRLLLLPGRRNRQTRLGPRLHEEYGTVSTYGGRTNVPIIFEDNLLISAVMVGWGDEPKWSRFAIPAHRFMCFNKATGELRWINGTSPSPYDTTFSTPTCLPVGGLQQLIFCSGDGGVWSLQPRTGKVVWNFPFGRAGMNVSPLVTRGRPRVREPRR